MNDPPTQQPQAQAQAQAPNHHQQRNPELFSVETMNDYSKMMSELISAMSNTDQNNAPVIQLLRPRVSDDDQMMTGDVENSKMSSNVCCGSSMNSFVDDLIDVMLQSSGSDVITSSSNSSSSTASKKRKLDQVGYHVMLKFEEEIVHIIEQSVALVVHAIVTELSTGSWRLWDTINLYSHGSAHADKLKSVVEQEEFGSGFREHEIYVLIAIINFSKEVIIPYFIPVMKTEILPRLVKYPFLTNDKDAYEMKKNAIFARVKERVVLGTFIMMREVLIFNEDRVFRGCKGSMKDFTDNNQNLNIAQVVATCVLIGALDRLEFVDSNLNHRIMMALKAYSTSDGEFRNCLRPINIDDLQERQTYDGRYLSENELVSQVICENRIIEQHPLNRSQAKCPIQSLPCSSASFISLVDRLQNLSTVKLPILAKASVSAGKTVTKNVNEYYEQDDIIDILN